MNDEPFVTEPLVTCLFINWIFVLLTLRIITCNFVDLVLFNMVTSGNGIFIKFLRRDFYVFSRKIILFYNLHSLIKFNMTTEVELKPFTTSKFLDSPKEILHTCVICASNALYKCPKCLTRTCSAKCSKTHKEENNVCKNNTYKRL